MGYNLNRVTDFSFRIACEGDLSDQGSLPQGDDGDETTLDEDDPYSAGVASQDDGPVIWDKDYQPDPPRPYIPAIFDEPRDPRDSYRGGASCDEVLKQCLCGECSNGNVVSGAGTGYVQPRGK